MTEPITQSQYVQQQLIKGERLNVIQANRERGIQNLRSIISTLRKNGWKIRDRRIVVLNGMGEKTMVNEYWMAVKKEERHWAGKSAQVG